MKPRWIAILLGAATTAGGQWMPLFDGTSLAGWKADTNAGSFTAEGGSIVACGPAAHLFYTGTDGAPADFRNFEFESEVLTARGTDSGIGFHVEFQDEGLPRKGCEVQILNTNRAQDAGQAAAPRTGSLLGLRHVFKSLGTDGEWFKLRIEARTKHVRVWVNDNLVTDYVEPSNPEAVQDPRHDRRLGHGTIALQCHTPDTRVEFRNLRLRPLPANEPTDVIPATSDEFDQLVAALNRDGFPLIDFHVHLKGGLTIGEALARSRRLGISYGIAFNCGLGFPVVDDRGIEAILQSMKGHPVFVGMQAEGREWTKMFSKEAIAKFDYVFTDGMTLTDLAGKRTRLWIPGEVRIGDRQEFMELLVKTTIGILDREPIDIYVNPLYLPDDLQPEFEQLWTAQRLQRVLDALERNGVALEISNRYRFLQPGFIRQAKAAGIKFTIGTNNADGNFGREDHALRMVRACGLTAGDMWTPKPDGQKPVQAKARP